jgi:hypothetical protein
MRAPKEITPIRSSRIDATTFGRSLDFKEKFAIIADLFNGYIGELLRLCQDLEPCLTVAEAKAVVEKYEKDEWLQYVGTMEMLYQKVEKHFRK